MSEHTEACIRGCRMYDRHLVECEGATDGTCRGCLPRRASHGHLCDTCHRRLQLMLTDVPTVVRWLTGNMPAGQGACRAREDHERAGGGKGAKSAEVPPPVKLDLLDLRDLLCDRMALWVDDWCEHKGLTGPERHHPDGDVEFLLTWLPGICKLDWIGDWWEELAETVSQAHALAPWRPVLRRIPQVACPGCAEANLAIFGGEEDVTCLSCGIMMTSNRFALWELVLKHEAAS